MTAPRHARSDYVVQLEVEAVAVVTVRAESAEAACAIAERDLRPVDVTEVRAAEAAIVSGPFAAVAPRRSVFPRRRPETASAGSDRGGQA